jgi:hypothetical protein
VSDDFKFLVGHKIVENHSEKGLSAIKLTDAPYEGIIFSYGKVEFPEDALEGENCPIKFDYEVYNNAGIEYNVDEFEKYIGDFLIELIVYQLSKNGIVYTGGIDDDNTDYIEQLDPQ